MRVIRLGSTNGIAFGVLANAPAPQSATAQPSEVNPGIGRILTSGYARRSTILRLVARRVRLMTAILIGVATSEIAFSEPVGCDSYADRSVAQYHENQRIGLRFNDNRWSPDFEWHKNWCQRVTASQAIAELLERAKILDRNGGNPMCDIEMVVEAKVTRIEVVDEADGGGSNSEPYLWTAFAQLDASMSPNDGHYFWGQLLENPESFTPAGRRPDLEWIHMRNGSHGNLGTNGGKGWDAGQTIQVPENVGAARISLIPPSYEKDVDGSQSRDGLHRREAGVLMVAVLMEEDDEPSSASMANRYARFQEAVAAIIYKEYNPTAWTDERPDPNHRFWGVIGSEAAESRIRYHVHEWLKREFPSTGTYDDIIGVAVKFWSWESLNDETPKPFEWFFHETGVAVHFSEDGDYRLYAEAKGKYVLRRPVIVDPDLID